MLTTDTLMPMHSPAHPGAIIEEYLGDVAVGDAAKKLDMTRANLSRVINGHQRVTADMARKLGIAFPFTDDEFWMRLQMNYDLAEERKKPKPKVKVIARKGDA